ncbi:ATP-binding protein [Ruminococcus sp. HUN007]|uniref:sensor histidine kinase n=1 Tax=Ruminococcus sp. HUN007 TaxID=1514668 RepID=UPI000679A176|nr:ATP-binding protein [Ruminococcus sp. HUN007]
MKAEEESLLESRLAEAEAKAAAEKEASRNFVSSVAHELRTPVAVIRGSLEALCDGIICEREQVKEYHRQMLNESIYLQRLVTDLLEFSRLQSASFSIIREPVNIADVVSDVCRSLKKIAEEKGVSLETGDESPVFIVNGDYARLRQMLIVILDNAVKFTDKGGRVTVSQHMENEKLYLTVSDTGCGIAEDELPLIFVKFHRTVTGQNRNGTGLGLAIAREIASRHGAEITAESKVGEGTTFTFCFSEKMTEEELEAYS